MDILFSKQRLTSTLFFHNFWESEQTGRTTWVEDFLIMSVLSWGVGPAPEKSGNLRMLQSSNPLILFNVLGYTYTVFPFQQKAAIAVVSMKLDNPLTFNDHLLRGRH